MFEFDNAQLTMAIAISVFDDVFPDGTYCRRYYWPSIGGVEPKTKSGDRKSKEYIKINRV